MQILFQILHGDGLKCGNKPRYSVVYTFFTMILVGYIVAGGKTGKGAYRRA